MLLREAADKGKSLKQQIIHSVNQQKDEEMTGEKTWKQNGLFPMRSQISAFQKKFPENTLVCTNQRTISTIKGDLEIYTNN